MLQRFNFMPARRLPAIVALLFASALFAVSTLLATSNAFGQPIPTPFAPSDYSASDYSDSNYAATKQSQPTSTPALSPTALSPTGISAEATAGDAIQIASEAMPAGVEEALAKGRELEAKGLWADAVNHYEEALRGAPNDRQLERRFDISRIHNSLDRRYHDTSFLNTVRSLDGQQALDMYGELLTKIGSHYVVNPPWNSLAHRGATAVMIAAGDKRFAKRHGLRLTEEQLRAFTTEVRNKVARKGQLTSSRDALVLANEISRLAEYRIGAPQSAWIFEFTTAAAGGLDNYSAFLTPDQLKDVYSQIEGNFVGLGVELKADGGALLIVRTITDSPAERAGIVAGDRIIAVDGKPTAQLSTDEAASLLTGEEGSIAYVTLAARDAETKPQPADSTYLVAKQVTPSPRVLAVRREHVEVPSLEESRIVDADYGVAYVRVPVFQKTTSRDLETALWDLHRQGMRSLIIDLRGNPGGLLTASVELADKFVAQGNIVSTRGRSEGEDFDYRAHRAGTWRVPLVVLIDGDSASASEIFAAAIHDNRRGTIVGVRSYGKGSVQGIFPMTKSGAGIRLTTAKFFSPNGQPISKVGVNPDIVVRRATSMASGHGEQHKSGYRGVEEAGDLALNRAVETARQQVAMR